MNTKMDKYVTLENATDWQLSDEKTMFIAELIGAFSIDQLGFAEDQQYLEEEFEYLLAVNSTVGITLY